jgi:hypothetical protein
MPNQFWRKNNQVPMTATRRGGRDADDAWLPLREHALARSLAWADSLAHGREEKEGGAVASRTWKVEGDKEIEIEG